MLDLLKKASLTQEEIVNLDKYLGDNIETMILYLGNNEILRLINLFNDKLEESSFYKKFNFPLRIFRFICNVYK